MTRELINEKLDSLSRCLSRLSQKRPATLAELESDIDLQDIIAINMERAVQLCVDIASILLAETNCPAPQTMGDGFRQLAQEGIISRELATQLVKAVGFRNLAVHAYDKIDWSIVYSLLDDDLADLRAFGAQIAELRSDP
jgi:uncharacterized protein YutE (UPF0331/DUF86 family)